MIIILPPVFSYDSHLFKIFKPISIKSIFSEKAIEPFDVCILSWLTRLDKLKFDLLGLTPITQSMRNELGSIINIIWIMVFFGSRLQKINRHSGLLNHLKQSSNKFSNKSIHKFLPFGLPFSLIDYSRKFLFVTYLSIHS